MLTLFGGQLDAHQSNLPILKIRPSRSARLALACDSPVWFSTHFLTKQYFCGGNDCPMCEGSTARTVGVLTVWTYEATKPRAYMLEVTRHAWNNLELGFKFAGSKPCRGETIEASRKKARSPLTMDPLSGNVPTPAPLAVAPFIITAYAAIHGLRGPADGETLDEWSHRTQQRRCELLNLAMQGIRA